MDEVELETLAKRVAQLIQPPASRRSALMAPAFLLSLLMIAVGAIFGYAKLNDHVDNLDQRVKGVEDATYSQKDAGRDIGDLKDKIDDLRKRDDRLESDVRQLLIDFAQNHK